MLCLIFSLLTVAATGLLRGRNLIPLKEFLYLDSYNIIWKNKTRMLEWTLNLGWRKGGEPKSPQGDSEVAFLPIPDSKNYLIYISWRVHCWESSEERELSSYDLLLLRLLLSKKKKATKAIQAMGGRRWLRLRGSLDICHGLAIHAWRRWSRAWSYRGAKRTQWDTGERLHWE